MEEKGKIKSIQGFRFVVFLGVFLSHSKINMGGAGALGVSIFLILSGFLMTTRGHQKEIPNVNAFRYATKKISTLYRLHIMMMLLCLALVLIEMYVETGIDVKLCIISSILNATLSQTYVPIYKIYSLLNGPSWYLCVVFLTYLIFPYFFRKIRNANVSKCYILLISLVSAQMLIAYMASFLPQLKTSNLSAQWLTYYFPPVRLIEFMIGCVLGQLLYKKQYNKPGKKLSTFIEIAIIILIIFFIWVYQNGISLFKYEYLRYSLLTLPFAIISIWVPICSNGVLKKVLESKLLVDMGNISGQCYLIHIFVIRLVSKGLHYLKIDMPILITVVGTLLITILLSRLYIEFNKKILCRHSNPEKKTVR